MNILKAHDVGGKKVIDSREVAEMVGRSHNELLKSIRIYSSRLAEGEIPRSEFFIESSYKDSTGRELPCYLITKRGCDMIANKLIGKKGTLFTAAYVTAFDEMSQQLTAPNRLPPAASPGGVARLIDSTRRVLLESGSTPQDVRQMACEVYQTWNVPVPTPLRYSAQLSLFSSDYQQSLSD